MTPTKILAIVLLAMMIVPPASVAFSAENGNAADEIELNFEIETSHETDDSVRTTRSSSARQDNYQIIIGDELSMPEVNGSWTQNDWSGGSGQDVWQEPNKFRASSNLNIIDPNGYLELDTGQTIEAWQELGKAPTARYRHNMVYSPSREVFYIFGGLDADYTSTNKLYEYNPATNVWTEKGKTNPPSARCAAMMVWDSVNNQLWLYGGSQYYYSYLKNDLWVYNPETDQWAQKSDGPGARNAASMVFNPAKRELILYGGYMGDSYNPSGEVYVYHITSNTWIQKNSFTTRYNHDAVWVPKTNTMIVYGGIEKYQSGSGYIYPDMVNEYFPNGDTWVNRSSKGARNRPVMAWDSDTEKIIVNSGLNTGYNNETWHYDVESDSWTQKLDGPQTRDQSDGDYDTVKKQFVTFGGRYYDVLDNYWAYSPNYLAYSQYGDLKSSVFDAGHKINPRSVSYTLKNELPAHLTNFPIKIQIAGSDSSPSEADHFIGPTGSPMSYFTQSSGDTTPASLMGSQYLAYEINISTSDPLFTPEFESITVDYFTYPDSFTYQSQVYELDNTIGYPLRHVTWEGTESVHTGIEVYFRQSLYKNDLDSASWENLEIDQTNFNYDSGKYFQYKVVLTSGEPSSTPILKSLAYTFNEPPMNPQPLLPENDSWVGTSQPELSWKFDDTDDGDYQMGLEITVSVEETFTFVSYTTNKVESMDNTHTVAESLDDGTYYWRVRTQDNYGSWSDWSDSMIVKIDTNKPLPPNIDCLTHPFESLWYSNNQPRFDWNEPVDITGIAGYSYSLDQSADGEPPEQVIMTNDEYNTKRNMQDFNGFMVQNDILPDGIWYFHLKAQDNLGTWSDIATHIVRIDTEPPKAVDFSPKNVPALGMLIFNFNITDKTSGIELATISWKYTSEVDFRYDELIPDQNTGMYMHSHQLESTSDLYIEYYISATDKTQPVNELRYPISNQNKISILDTIPPIVKDVTGNTVQNMYDDMDITIEVNDNVGISEARIYFNDQSNGKSMTKNSDGTFSYEIKRRELIEMTGYAGDNIILYNIKVWDNSQNSVKIPENGNFNITIKDLETQDDPTDDNEESDEGGLPTGYLINIMIMVVFIVIVAIVLFVFVRKQSEKIHADRHTLRMAIADVQEGAAQGTGAPTTGTKDNIDTPPVPSLKGSSIFDVGQQGSSSPVPRPIIDIAPDKPTIPTAQIDQKPSPTGYLPPAPQPAVDTNTSASILGGLEQEQPDDKYSGKVMVDSGVFVSIPGDSKSTSPSPGDSKTADPAKANQATSSNVVNPDDKKQIWRPPGT